jgi:hypothetical protein
MTSPPAERSFSKVSGFPDDVAASAGSDEDEAEAEEFGSMAVAEVKARHPKAKRKKTPWRGDRLAKSEFMRIRIKSLPIISEL